jgi:formyl-CoA transferase
MRSAEVVSSPVFSVADIFEDQTYQEREDIVSIEDDELGTVRMQAVVPKLANHAGRVWRTGPSLGQDNDLVFTEYLGLGAEDYAGLKKRGVI